MTWPACRLGAGADGAPFGQQLDRPLRGDRLGRVALAQRRVGLAVGDVGAEPAVPEHDRLAGSGVVAELAQRRRGRARRPAPGFRLREQLPGLVQGDREHLLLGLQRPAVRTLLDVGPVTAVLGGHRLAVDLAQGPRQGQQPQRVIQRHAVQVHGLQQRGGARLGRRGRVVVQLLGHVRAEPARLRDDRPAGGRVGAEDLVAGRPGQQLGGQLGGQLVRRGALGDVGPLAVAFQVRAVPADPDHDVGAGQRNELMARASMSLRSLTSSLSPSSPSAPK